MTNTPLPAQLFPDVAWFIQGIRNKGFNIGMGGWYIKQSRHNRYTIAGPNDLQNLIIPVVHTGVKKQLKETRISEHSKWFREHKHAMRCAYGKAPFYEFYDYRIHALFTPESDSLSALIMASVTLMHELFKLEVPLIFTEDSCESFNPISVNPYPQVFEEKFGFRTGVSALDLLFNLGPEAEDYLQETVKSGAY